MKYYGLLCLAFGLTTFVNASTIPMQIEGNDLLTQKPVTLRFNEATKGTVLVFLSAKCPCSSSHETILKNLKAEFEPKGFHFLAIHSNQDEDLSTTRLHFEKSGLNFPILQDHGAVWADTFKAFKTPHAYILNPQGEVLYQGGVSDSHVGPDAKKQYLKEALTALSLGQTPEQNKSRVLGCMISRKK